jgi:hypothetical protein
MRNALDAFLLCSVVFFSMGFLVIAFYMNRAMMKDARHQRPIDDDD